jgi:hypothetical protein
MVLRCLTNLERTKCNVRNTPRPARALTFVYRFCERLSLIGRSTRAGEGAVRRQGAAHFIERGTENAFLPALRAYTHRFALSGNPIGLPLGVSGSHVTAAIGNRAPGWGIRISGTRWSSRRSRGGGIRRRADPSLYLAVLASGPGALLERCLLCGVPVSSCSDTHKVAAGRDTGACPLEGGRQLALHPALLPAILHRHVLRRRLVDLLPRPAGSLIRFAVRNRSPGIHTPVLAIEFHASVMTRLSARATEWVSRAS